MRLPKPPFGRWTNFLGTLIPLFTRSMKRGTGRSAHRAREMAKHDRSKLVGQVRHSTAEVEEARKMLAVVEKSQTPLGESAGIFAKLKLKIDASEPLSQEEHRQLQRLVNIARDWEKGVESSAQTEREETLAG